MTINIVGNTNYKYGTINKIEDRSIPRGAASRSLNWLTMGDHIELRRGQKFLGTTNTGLGLATGLKRVTDATGVERLFGSYGKKLKYYNRTTEDWVEIGSDLLGSAVVDANGIGFEEIFMQEYVGLAGNQLWINSPNCAGFFKIMVANPGSAKDNYDANKNHKGNIKIDTNRTLLWGRVKDRTGLYGSYIDSQTYTTVSAESLGTGDGVTTVFSTTLAAVTGIRTCFGLTVTAGAVTLTDDYNGVLSASDGSTGTINYSTGAISVTFATAPANLAAITVTYQWESSTTNGIADFTESGTRLAGEGFVFRQDEGGGPLQNVNTYNQIYYCMHLKKTWVLSLGSDDTDATNLPYRQRVGIPNERASVETGDGIYYIDDTDENDVRARLLTYELNGSPEVIPVAISKNLNLNDYRFDQAAAAKWGDLVLFACGLKNSTREINSKTVTLNNRVLVYNLLWKSWDILDYGCTCFEIYDGSLVAGDAYSDNFALLFSGFDDFDAVIPNYWEGDLDALGVEGLKQTKKLYLQGLIDPDQKIKVSVALDNGAFVEVGGTDNAEGTAAYDEDGAHTYAIQGNGSYVDPTQSVAVGAVTLGRSELGGGSAGAVAYNFARLISLRVDKFERVKLRFEAVDVGFASISTHKWWDVRFKGVKIPRKYR